MLCKIFSFFFGNCHLHPKQKPRTFMIEYQLDGKSCAAVIEVEENQKISKNFFYAHLCSLIYHTPNNDSQVRLLAPTKVSKLVIFITSVKEIK